MAFIHIHVLSPNPNILPIHKKKPKECWQRPNDLCVHHKITHRGGPSLNGCLSLPAQGTCECDC